MTTVAGPGNDKAPINTMLTNSGRRQGSNRNQSKILSPAAALASHYIRAMLKQPFFMAFTLFQPMLYLLMFSGLFSGMAALEGFEDKSYISFLTPGVVLMTAVFGGGWSGMGAIEAHERGTLPHLLTTPTPKVAIVLANVARLAVAVVIQSAIVLGVGAARGARFEGGIVGILVLVATAIALGALLGQLSLSLALRIRRQEGVVSVINILVLPMTFSASLYVPHEQMPPWIRAAARANPADWAIVASREAMSSSQDWAQILIRLGGLGLLVVLGCWACTRSLAAYQRSY